MAVTKEIALRELAALTSGNRQLYRNACSDAADEIEKLRAEVDALKAENDRLRQAAMQNYGLR